MTQTRNIEHRLGLIIRSHLPGGLGEFAMFVFKQGWAALFGGLMLFGILVSAVIWPDDARVARYDVLFLYAVLLQVMMLAFKLETWKEAQVILLFHITGTAMEWFKVSAGSWAYPETALFKVYDVPLFSGFMYAAVGSYIARVIRIFDMRFVPYPPLWISFIFAVAIYVNFFAHHFLPDIRIALFAATLLLFARTKVWFFISRWFWMPMPLAAFFAAIALWIAENVGTFTGTWVYAGQGDWEMVSLAKLGSWYLLLYVSFITVTIVSRDALCRSAVDPRKD
ncbi:MAG: DUF817 domain-containing protein [Planktomarina sp.]